MLARVFRRSAFLGALAAVALLAPVASQAAAATIDEFTLPKTEGSNRQVRPTYVATSPSGEVWYVDSGREVVVGLNGAGEVIDTEASPRPVGDLAFAPDGSLAWTTENSSGEGGYGLRKPDSTVEPKIENDSSDPFAIAFTPADGFWFTAFTEGGPWGFCSASQCSGTLGSQGRDLTVGPGGAFWATAPETDTVRKMAFTASINVNLPKGTNPQRAALGSDGNLWVTGFGSAGAQNRIVRITGTGEQTAFPLPPERGPFDITAGADGALWFTENASNSIGRITTSGEYSSCPLPSSAVPQRPYGITTGTDGSIWFAEREVGKMGRLTGNCVGAGGGGGGPVPPPPNPPAAPQKPTPALSQLKLSPAAFKSATGGGAVAKSKATTATTISFRVNVASTVTFAVSRKASGRRAGGTCQAPKPANAGKPKCPRYLPVGKFGASAGQGAGSVPFSGRLGGKALAPGGYRLDAVAAADGKKSAPASASFTVLAR